MRVIAAGMLMACLLMSTYAIGRSGVAGQQCQLREGLLNDLRSEQEQQFQIYFESMASEYSKRFGKLVDIMENMMARIEYLESAAIPTRSQTAYYQYDMRSNINSCPLN